ncbi:uncharacterized protein LOC118262724 [Spodoptera frugiperda]|uniref:Uncharacterized protein LOC118262724 n=1 Tax=Spodoptera frugiperda TaxID=7108 RepID=A0A9R0EX17_SPOFR|nr:uncharacterized protein LOC118262724 [Spodoptera frugiperda]
MDSAVLIFVFTLIINILKCEAITLEDTINLLLKYRRSLQTEKDGKDKIINTNPQTKKYRSSFYGADEDEDEISYRRAFVSAEDLGDFRKNTKYEFDPNDLYKTNRRLYDSHAGMRSPIIGAPRVPSHLPEAEAILPGHTLIRPALGMLKSAVKFPHKDLDNGAGVYGNIDSLGITYGGTGERILYTGFRRNNNDFSLPESSDSLNFRPRYIIALVRKKPRNKVTYKYNNYDNN